MFGVSFAQISQNIISYIVTQCKRSWFNLISRDCEFPENFCTMKIRPNFGILRSAIFQNHLGLMLNIKLNILEQTYMNTQKIYKTLDWLHMFQPILLWSSLLATYKTYITSQLDSSGNNRSDRRGVVFKNIPRLGLRISKVETLVENDLSLLQLIQGKPSFVFTSLDTYFRYKLSLKTSSAKSDEISQQVTKVFADKYLLTKNIFYRNYLVSNCWKISLSINFSPTLSHSLKFMSLKKFMIISVKIVQTNNEQ